jgi:hypothetical protein
LALSPSMNLTSVKRDTVTCPPSYAEPLQSSENVGCLLINDWTILSFPLGTLQLGAEDVDGLNKTPSLLCTTRITSPQRRLECPPIPYTNFDRHTGWFSAVLCLQIICVGPLVPRAKRGFPGSLNRPQLSLFVNS